jgi:CHASE3 domain sensor protein
MWEILMLGLSTRKYAQVLPKMAETVGVSKSEVSRQFVESSAEVLKQLMERLVSRRGPLLRTTPQLYRPYALAASVCKRSLRFRDSRLHPRHVIVDSHKAASPQ